MRQRLFVIMILAIATATTGCVFDAFRDYNNYGDRDGYTQPYDDDRWAAPDSFDITEANFAVDNAWLAGDMGSISDFRGASYETVVEGYYGLSVTIHTGQRGGDDHGWAMARLSLTEADLMSDAWVPGTVREFQSAAYDGGSDDFLGCSGAEHGRWDFDEPAPNYTVRVEEGTLPGERVFLFEARFSTGQVVEGGFSANPLVY